jgi:acetyl esterase
MISFAENRKSRELHPMNVMADPPRYEVTTEDIEYLRIDDVPLLARLYRPRGNGPFPAVVGVHGGAWTGGDRLNNALLDQAVAAAGVVVLALDFRLAPQWRYPAPVADINFGVRWLKANASRLGSRAEWVGAVASSSGGHQMLLNALRPGDPRYAALPLPGHEDVDAAIAYAVACWPIADPLARYRMAQARGVDRLVASHDAFFVDAATMAEANPQMILERRERVGLPPLLLLQGTNDDNVTPEMAEKFVIAWRAAGGRAVYETFEGMPHAFVTREPEAAASRRAVRLVIDFVRTLGSSA